MSPTETTFRRSLLIQGRIIGALLLREIITRYGRHNVGFLWLFLEPMMFTLGVATLWNLMKATHGFDLPIIAFALTGYSSVLLWRNGSSRCINALEPNYSLLHHRNVRAIDIYFARLLLEVTGSSASLILLTTLFVSLGLMKPPDDIFLSLMAWLLLAWFSIALGMLVGAASERTEVIERVWHVVTYLIFPLSGAAFMLDWMPTAAQKALSWLPMIHGVEMLRHGYFGNIVRTHEDPAYLFISNLILTLIGLALLRETARRVEPG